MARLSVGAVVFIWGYMNLHPWPSEWNSKWKIWMYQSHVSWFCRLVTVLCCSEYIIKLVWKYLKLFNFAEKFVYINYEKKNLCLCVWWCRRHRDQIHTCHLEMECTLVQAVSWPNLKCIFSFIISPPLTGPSLSQNFRILHN